MPSRFNSEIIHTLRYARTVGLLVALAVAAVTAVLLDYESREAHTQANADALAFVSSLRARADRELNAVLYLSSGLAGYFTVRKDRLDEDEILRILEALYRDARHIRNFSISTDYTIRYVYPPEGNLKAVGVDYRNLPEQWPDVRRAVENRQGLLVGPVKLVQGGEGLIYRLPVFIDNRYWGMIATVVDTGSFTRSAFGEADGREFDFAVRVKSGGKSEGRVLWGDPAVLRDGDALLVTAEVPGGEWEYAVRAKNPHHQTGTHLILHMMGLLLALGAGYGIYSLLRHRIELGRLAMFDALTGLPNRRLLNDRLVQAIRRHDRAPDGQCAVLFVDLDGFKEVNDRYGHEAGDALLRTVAERITHEVRISDTVARLGGDEFVVVLEDTDQVRAEQLVARLHKRLADPVDADGHLVKIGASVGMALYPEEGEDPEVLLRLADERMYGDKQRRKGESAPS
ncbi:MAG: diguanylate cyclase [Pseudomonadota bacterium]